MNLKSQIRINLNYLSQPFLSQNVLPSTIVLILTSDSIVLELASPKNIDAMIVDVHKNRNRPRRTADNFFTSLYFT